MTFAQKLHLYMLAQNMYNKVSMMIKNSYGNKNDVYFLIEKRTWWHKKRLEYAGSLVNSN